MASKETEDLRKRASELDIEFTNKTTVKALAKMVAEAEKSDRAKEDKADEVVPLIKSSGKHSKTPVVEISEPQDIDGFVETTDDEEDEEYPESNEGLTPEIIESMKVTTKGSVKQKMMKKERVIVIDMSPADSVASSDIFSVGNDFVGQIKWLVQFGVPWHVPAAILNLIESKELSMTRETVNSKGQTIVERYNVPRYSIKRLEPLTKTELAELAKKQSLLKESGEQ